MPKLAAKSQLRTAQTGFDCASWFRVCKQVVISEEMDLETLLTLSESDIHDLGIEGEEATKLVQFIASHS